MSRRPDQSIDLTADRKHVLSAFRVSRETATRLDRLVALLLVWQRRTNLISASTMSSLWTRHVADSLQLLDLVPTSSQSNPPIWLDLGSGGGFPGIVIACALADIPGACVHLVESNMKKAAFLREVIRESKAPGIVHAARIETLDPVCFLPMPDYITARALAPLPDLFAMIAPFVKRGAKALLPKGQDLDIELTEATKHWNIRAEQVASKTSETGRVLIVHALSRREPLGIRRSTPNL